MPPFAGDGGETCSAHDTTEQQAVLKFLLGDATGANERRLAVDVGRGTEMVEGRAHGQGVSEGVAEGEVDGEAEVVEAAAGGTGHVVGVRGATDEAPHDALHGYGPRGIVDEQGEVGALEAEQLVGAAELTGGVGVEEGASEAVVDGAAHEVVGRGIFQLHA